MHKNHGNRDNQFENYKYMAFLIILDTAYGSLLWSVPSQFEIFWSPVGTNKPSFLVLLTKIGVTTGYNGWKYFIYVRMELD